MSSSLHTDLKYANVVQRSDISLWAKSFGAQVFTDITKQTTHVVANPSRKTTKVKKASHHPHIKIVTTEWLLQCFSKWERVPEDPYIIPVDPTEHGPHGGSPTLSNFEELEAGPILSGDDDEDTPFTGTEDDKDPKSPIPEISEETWQSLGDEFQEFMDESDDEDDGTGSDSESVHSENSVSTNGAAKKKRKRGTDPEENSEADDSDASTNSAAGSKLQRKKKRVLERVSSLTNVVSADKSSGLPSPDTTGPEEGHEENGAEDRDEEGDAELEAELLAELEREEMEEAEAGVV